LGELLRTQVDDVQHVRDLGLRDASDGTILEAALRAGRILALDGDFAALLAHAGAALPSVIHLRSSSQGRPEAQCPPILQALTSYADVLLSGAIVSVHKDQIRCRPLPIETKPRSK